MERAGVFVLFPVCDALSPKLSWVCGRLAAGPELNFAVLLRFRPLEPIDL